MSEYPFVIYESEGVSWSELDRAANVETVVSILYGDLSYHPGEARRVVCPAEYVGLLKTEAEGNADCWGIPVDIVEAKR